jgi:hypothetical protein
MSNFEPRASNASSTNNNNPFMNDDEDNPYTAPKHVNIPEEEVIRI